MDFNFRRYDVSNQSRHVVIASCRIRDYKYHTTCCVWHHSSLLPLIARVTETESVTKDTDSQTRVSYSNDESYVNQSRRKPYFRKSLRRKRLGRDSTGFYQSGEKLRQNINRHPAVQRAYIRTFDCLHSLVYKLEAREFDNLSARSRADS